MSLQKDAQIDLAGNISGHFSPEDWSKILDRARTTLEAHMALGKPDGEAWNEVIREFHRERYWGFKPNYVPVKVRRERDLGVSLMVMLFLSFTLVLIAICWLGQIYTFSDETKDTRMFYLCLVCVVSIFAYFLWRHRQHTD